MVQKRVKFKKAQKNQYTFIILSLFSGIFCYVYTVYINYKVGSKEAPSEPKTIIVGEFDTIDIPVPINKIEAGSLVKNIQFKNIQFPKHQLSEGIITNVDSILEASAIMDLPPAVPVFKNSFSINNTKINPVVDKIPEGMRAMTVKVDATSSVEGWAGTGSIVDVLLVTNKGASVIAEQVKILSAERSVVPVENNDPPQVPSTVTLLVTQEQCLAINSANTFGKIAFALRNFEDSTGWRVTSYHSDNLLDKGSIKKSKINGYVSFNDNSNKREFALKDGSWMNTKGKPEGFFVSGSQ